MPASPAQNVGLALQPGAPAVPLNQAVTAALANIIGYVLDIDIHTATTYVGGAGLVIAMGVSLSTNKSFMRIISGSE